MRDIHRSFPGVQALRGVDLDVRSGEVHALVGENGAGKSTLINILTGVIQPDRGAIFWRGQEVTLDSEQRSRELGIATVFQERCLFGPLSVAENVFVGRQPADRAGRIDRRRLHEATRRLLERLGLDLSPRRPVDELSPDQQQLVEVARALSLEAELILLDEPTAALSESETANLFRVIRQLRAENRSVVYISHRLEEIFEIADRVTVLKDGEGQGTLDIRETSPDDLVRRMVGRERVAGRVAEARAPGPVVLEVRDLGDREPRSGGRALLRDISFRLHRGEILGLAGLAGAGRTELALAIFGARPRARGEVRLEGRTLALRSPADAVAAGIGYLPEDRKESGLFHDRSVAGNIAAAGLGSFGEWWYGEEREREVARGFVGRLHIGCRDVNDAVSVLSGGNQQKTLLARWFHVDPKVLIVDEPTRGVDVGAKSEVHAILREFTGRGGAVIAISSDLPEIVALADRIIVLREGRIAGELHGSEATEERVMQLATMG